METPVVNVRPVRVAGVRFQPIGKVYDFDASGEPDLQVGDFVIVETARGRQMGEVAWLGPLTGDRQVEGPLKPIERRATGRDLAIRRYWEGKELEALVICREVNKNLGLPIKIVKAEYSFDGTRLTFLYSSESEEKIETKDLRQEVSKSFRARVEMKLIGPRDVAKLIGGFGACGEVRCCSRFLAEFSPVSIKMAKEQGISLNPQEITGICGRLRCCLVYEYEQYAVARKALPQRGKEVGTPHGKGTVVDALPIKDSALVQVGEQSFEVHRDQIQSLEEWEALQQRTAEPSDLGKAAAQAARQAEEHTARASEPPSAERGERAAQRRHRRTRRHGRPTDRQSPGGASPSSKGPQSPKSADNKPASPRRRRRH